MLQSLRTTKGRIFIAFVTSVVFAVLWIAYELPVAILPAILSGLWIPMFAKRNEPVSPRLKVWLWAALGVGVLSLGVAIMVFFLTNN
jgi:hypothetical protein|tara:strand:- start:106 stop:366 length:261 start_codon:yes stop_codon:yes gene_type:complete